MQRDGRLCNGMTGYVTGRVGHPYGTYIIGERSEPLSRVFNDQPRDIYGGVRTYVQNASCYFSKLKLRSPIMVRTYVILAL